MTPPDAELPGDLWEGELDESGFPSDRDDVYGADVAPHVAEAEIAGATPEEAVAARYRLPEEFWGARDMFKTIRQAAWANGAHPDAVLGSVLARASGAAGNVMFDSGRGVPATMSLFVCLLAKSGIGKSEAQGAAGAVVELPSWLCTPDGFANQEIFPDGIGIGSGEGIAEQYMGTVEEETGNVTVKGRGRNAQPEPEMKQVRRAVRHRAFFYVDEGEALTKLMHERSGATLGPTLRTAWSGGTLGQANATQDRYRFVPARSYTCGIVIGYQPETAVSMLADVGPGTPQRFLWLGAQDTEMPDELYEMPERVVVPPETGNGPQLIRFPIEIKRWLRRQHVAKHRGEVEVDPMDAHEPLMRCKLAALFCWLDGRHEVDRDDWVLGGMVWSVSCAIRDRLIRHRDTQAARAAEEKRSARMAEATELEVMKATVTGDVERVARRIVRIVDKTQFDTEKKHVVRRDMGRDKKFFDAAVVYAVGRGWLAEDDGAVLVLGDSRPAES